MRRYFLIIVLVIIGILGLSLRLIDYDRVPQFGETQDEFFYSWAGMTWLKTGIPIAWSWFPSYQTRNIVSKWGINYPLVSPWIEKPPLYTLIQGVWMKINQVNGLFDVRLSLIRIVPIFLSFLTIVLTGLLASQLFSRKIGATAALLYAVVPSIILSNRLSLTENLLTIFVLLTLITLYIDSKKIWQPIFVGIFCGLAVLTKNIGLVVGLIAIAYYLVQKKWSYAVIVSLIFGAFNLIHPLIGYYFNWNLYIGVMNDYKVGFATAGLPELIPTLFRYQTISSKDHIFYDGSMLLGFLLLFISPWWFFPTKQKQLKHAFFISFSIGYMIFLALLASGAEFSFYGWHVYPIYPFLMILLANILFDLYKKFDIGKTAVTFLILGSSTIRFGLLFVSKEIQNLWQYPLGGLFMIALILYLVPSNRFKKLMLLLLFIIFIAVNIYASANLIKIYPNLPQPLS